MKSRPIVVYFVFLSLAFGCHKDGFDTKSTPVFEVDGPRFQMPADSCTQSFIVKSNRGWNVIPDEQYEWIVIESLEHDNMSGVLELTPFPLTVSQNTSLIKRAAYISFLCEGDTTRVQIVQNGLVLKLNPTGPLSFYDINDDGARIPLLFETNGAWHARVDSESSASLVLSQESGLANEDTLFVNIGPNKDERNQKHAKVIVSVCDCDDLVYEFFQKPMSPRFETVVDEIELRSVNPEVFSSLGGERNFRIESNMDWSAEINKEETTASNVTIEPLSGSLDLEKFTVTVKGTNSDFNTRKKIVIDFKSNGKVIFQKVFFQEKASIIAFEFQKQDMSLGNWPFAIPSSSPKDTNYGYGHFETSNGIRIGWFASHYCFLDKEGLQLGYGRDNYLELPVIENHRLRRVTLYDNKREIKPKVMTPDGLVVKGGGYSSYYRQSFPFTWQLQDTAKDAEYRIVIGERKTLSISCLELEYE